MYESSGIMSYGPGGKVVVLVDQGISDFYRSLIPKYYYSQPQMYDAHITVVRSKKEFPSNMDVWNKYDGIDIPFSYASDILFDGTYFYLNVQSDMIGDIRVELGLPRFRFGDLGADRKCYHITIGNVKRDKYGR